MTLPTEASSSTRVSFRSNGGQGISASFRTDSEDESMELDSGFLSSGHLDNNSRMGSIGSSSFRSSSRRLSSLSTEIKQVDRRKSYHSNAEMNNLTINKLKIDSIGLVGREKEIVALQNCVKRMVRKEKDDVPTDSVSVHSLHKPGTAKELVFIKGYSGVGKSSLARAIQTQIQSDSNGMFVQGKFDQQNSDEPYSGIVSAFDQILRGIVNEPSFSVSQITREISEALGSDVQILIHLIPQLEAILMTDHAKTSVTSIDMEKELERMKHAFRVLMRVLNAHISPLVLVIDDVQWADVSSLDAIDYLISDVQNVNPLLIICCYRSNEVDENSFLHNKITTLEQKKDSFNFNVTDISLDACSVEEVNKIVMAMMDIDDPETTRGLAEVCYKRTLGNPFFLREFMLQVYREEHLTYNLGMLKWVWDEREIEDATVSTANVIDLLRSRMRKLPDDIQLLLQFAAFLGAAFSMNVLKIIWNKHVVLGRVDDAVPLDDLVETMQDEHFVEKYGIDRYRWVHDKVQEAALTINGDIDQSFQFDLGVILYQSLGEKELEDALFDVLDLINTNGSKARLEFAELNLKAAKKAMQLSAFHSAARYIAYGISFLPEDKWNSHRSLTLSLHTMGAEVNLILGNVEEAETYANAVLSRHDVTTMEILPIKKAKARKLCSNDLKFLETVDYTLEILKSLGCKLIWNRKLVTIQAITTLTRTFKMVKSAPRADKLYEKVGTMTDPKQKAIMFFLARLSYACYNLEMIFLNALVICKTVELTLKYGVNEVSGPGFASMGILAVAVQQDYDTAFACAAMALALERSNKTARNAETIYIAHVFSMPWKKPFQSCITAFAGAYPVALSLGDTEYAMWCLIMDRVMMPYVMGKQLEYLLEQFSNMLSQMEEFAQASQQFFLKMLWQLVENLHSQEYTESVKQLKGEKFDSSKFKEKSTFLVGSLCFMEGELLFYSDIEAAAKRAITDGDKYERLSPAGFTVMIELFHRAVALYAAARKTGKRKYKVQAKKLRDRVQSWVKAGNPNVQHYEALLNAEHLAIMKKDAEAEEYYKSAVVLAARTGHLHHAGLCNERYADFLIQQRGDPEEGKYRLTESIRFYEEWGAKGKVDALKKIL